MNEHKTNFISETSEPNEDAQLLKLKSVYVSAYEWFEYAYYCSEKGGPSAWERFKNVNINEEYRPTKINEKKIKKLYDNDCKKLKEYVKEYVIEYSDAKNKRGI